MVVSAETLMPREQITLNASNPATHTGLTGFLAMVTAEQS